MKTLSSASLALLVFASAHAQSWVNQSVSFWGKPVSVALPENYHRLPDDDSRVIAMNKFYSGNWSLKGYYLADDFHYVLILAFAPSKNYAYSATRWTTDLANYKASFAGVDRNEIARMVNQQIATALDGSSAIKLERPVMLPVFDESLRHYSSLMLSAVNSEIDGQKERMVMCGALTTLYVADRIVTLNTYSVFEGTSTYTALETLTKEIVRRTISANEKRP